MTGELCVLARFAPVFLSLKNRHGEIGERKNFKKNSAGKKIPFKQKERGRRTDLVTISTIPGEASDGDHQQ